MQFVILFASLGRYLSRNLHQVIKNIISNAMESVAASANTDPYRFFSLCFISMESVVFPVSGFKKLVLIKQHVAGR